MTYATSFDLVERFGPHELAQRAPSPGGGSDTARIQRALDDATAEIDSYVGMRYPLPLTEVPPLIKRLACDIARYRLYDDAAPEEVRARYDDAVSVLRKIAAGQICVLNPPSADDLAAVVRPTGRSWYGKKSGGCRSCGDY
jgi:phage gp36-like protein